MIKFIRVLWCLRRGDAYVSYCLPLAGKVWFPPRVVVEEETMFS